MDQDITNTELVTDENQQVDNDSNTSSFISSNNITSLLNGKIKYILVIFVILSFFAGGILGYFIFNKYNSQKNKTVTEPSSGESNLPVETITPMITLLPTEIPSIVTPSPVPTKKPTTVVIITPAPKPTPTPTPTPPSVPTPTPTSVLETNPSSNPRCEVNISPQSGPAPLTVTLSYSAFNLGNTYVTGIQWDYNGDGNWDSDMSSGNGRVTYTYSNVGVYSPRMRLQLSDGSITDSCSSSLAVQPH